MMLAQFKPAYASMRAVLKLPESAQIQILAGNGGRPIKDDGRSLDDNGVQDGARLSLLFHRVFFDAGQTQVLRGHSRAVTCLGALADGRVVSGSEDGTLQVWGPGAYAAPPEPVEEQVAKGKAQAEGVAIEMKALQDGAAAWEPEPEGGEREGPVEMKGHTSYVACVTQVREHVVSGSCDHSLRVWDPGTGLCTAWLRGHTAPVLRVQHFTEDLVLSLSWDCTVRLWKVSSAPEIDRDPSPSIGP